MPILKENKTRYPKDWPAIAERIKFDRAEGQCEMKTLDGERCSARHGHRHPYTGSIVVLTVAHMNHKPEDCREDNLASFATTATTRRTDCAAGSAGDELRNKHWSYSMKQPTKLMKRALQQSRELKRYDWLKMPEIPEEAFAYQKFILGSFDAATGADPIGKIAGHKSHEETITATIGESFSWTTDADGDVIELLGVSDDGLPMYSGKLNEEQKERWKRITG